MSRLARELGSESVDPEVAALRAHLRRLERQIAEQAYPRKIEDLESHRARSSVGHREDRAKRKRPALHSLRRGDYTPSSDVDILHVVDHSSTPAWKRPPDFPPPPGPVGADVLIYTEAEIASMERERRPWLTPRRRGNATIGRAEKKPSAPPGWPIADGVSSPSCSSIHRRGVTGYRIPDYSSPKPTGYRITAHRSPVQRREGSWTHSSQ